ncbi:MAG: hypothetical protein JWM59_1544 [Verrucomicrobiales bacterium]|nr:hypothetical protein [Verrucomicrobiales bacterium]
MLFLELTLDTRNVQETLNAVMEAAGDDQSKVNRRVAQSIEVATQRYLAEERGTQHETATRLGADPTHFYAGLARFVSASSNGDGAELTMPRQGLSRAFFTYLLEPRHGSKLLTIPVKKESYGRRARTFQGLRWSKFTDEDVAEGRSDTAGLVLGKPAGRANKKKGVRAGMFIALYRGAKRATIKQDRQILPSDQEWLGAADAGVAEYIDELLS